MKKRICPDCNGKRRKYKHRCDDCIEKREKELRKAAYKRNIKKIKAYRKKYRKEHREEIKEAARKYNIKATKEKRIAKEKLFDDIIKNPKKYLERV